MGTKPYSSSKIFREQQRRHLFPSALEHLPHSASAPSICPSNCSRPQDPRWQLSRPGARAPDMLRVTYRQSRQQHSNGFSLPRSLLTDRISAFSPKLSLTVQLGRVGANSLQLFQFWVSAASRSGLPEVDDDTWDRTQDGSCDGFGSEMTWLECALSIAEDDVGSFSPHWTFWLPRRSLVVITSLL